MSLLALLAFFGQFWLLFATFCNFLATFDQELPVLPDPALEAVLAATPGMYVLCCQFFGFLGLFLAIFCHCTLKSRVFENV